MNILILSDIEASGEWLAIQTLLEELKKINNHTKLYLIAYGQNKLLLNKEIFSLVIVIT